MMTHKIRKTAVMMTAALALGGGVAAATIQPASASVSGCSGGRCTIWFSKSDTREISQFRAPDPGPVPIQIKVAYYAMVSGHAFFAKQYADRGWCSAFVLSIYPWETQGYYGYQCNWN